MNGVTNGIKAGWHVGEKYREQACGGMFGDDAVGTAGITIYRRKYSPWKFAEQTHYIVHVRAYNQPKESTCKGCGREGVQESIVRGVFHCDDYWGQGCGLTWADPDADHPMRYSVDSKWEAYSGKRGQTEDEIRNDGQPIEVDYESHDILWYHTEAEAQAALDRRWEREDMSAHICY